MLNVLNSREFLLHLKRTHSAPVFSKKKNPLNKKDFIPVSVLI